MGTSESRIQNCVLKLTTSRFGGVINQGAFDNALFNTFIVERIF